MASAQLSAVRGSVRSSIGHTSRLKIAVSVSWHGLLCRVLFELVKRASPAPSTRTHGLVTHTRYGRRHIRQTPCAPRTKHQRKTRRAPTPPPRVQLRRRPPRIAPSASHISQIPHLQTAPPGTRTHNRHACMQRTVECARTHAYGSQITPRPHTTTQRHTST